MWRDILSRITFILYLFNQIWYKSSVRLNEFLCPRLPIDFAWVRVYVRVYADFIHEFEEITTQSR